MFMVQEEFDAMYAMKTSHIPSRSSFEWNVAFEKNYDDAMKQTEAYFTRKGLEIATIANLPMEETFSENASHSMAGTTKVTGRTQQRLRRLHGHASLMKSKCSTCIKTI